MASQKQTNVFLVINKFAGHHKKINKIKDDVITFLQRNGCHVDHAFTQYGGHATTITADALQKGFELIVAVGGDGTVNEVSQGLKGTAGKMGIIPIGSGNGLARELGISMRVGKSKRTLLEGKIRHIDVCRINDHPFLCTCGIGFDAQIAWQMDQSASRGFWRYIQLTIRESLRFKSFRINMNVDGTVWNENVFMVTFANISQFGNHAYIAPKAAINDGLIDMVVIKPFHKIWLPVLGLLLFTPAIPLLPFVECHKIKGAELIEADAPRLHYDGEAEKPLFPAAIAIDHATLPVMAPKKI